MKKILIILILVQFSFDSFAVCSNHSNGWDSTCSKCGVSYCVQCTHKNCHGHKKVSGTCTSCSGSISCTTCGHTCPHTCPKVSCGSECTSLHTRCTVSGHTNDTSSCHTHSYSSCSNCRFTSRYITCSAHPQTHTCGVGNAPVDTDETEQELSDLDQPPQSGGAANEADQGPGNPADETNQAEAAADANSQNAADSPEAQTQADLDAATAQLDKGVVDEHKNSKDESEAESGPTDPVRLASGLFFINQTDYSVSTGMNPIQFKRHYTHESDESFSLGTGWFWNYDRRILRGENHYSIASVAEIERAASVIKTRYLDPSNNQKNQAVASLQRLIGLFETYRDDAFGIRNDIQAIQNRSDVINNGSASFKARLTRLYNSADTKYRNAIDKINLYQAVLNEFQSGNGNHSLGALVDQAASSNSSIAEIDRLIQDINGFADEAQSFVDYNSNADILNQYAAHFNYEPDFTKTGSDKLIWINSSGAPVVYSFLTPPDYSSTAVYPGTTIINHFPSGSLMANDDPDQPEIQLLADGTYRLAYRDQKVEIYDLYGRLTSITDLYNNRIDLNYGNGVVTAITDSFGRQFNVEWTGNRIDRITYENRTVVQYGYNTDNQLIFITDRNSDSVRYSYHPGSNRLHFMIKPDDSRREYVYSQTRDGKWVMEYNRDENAGRTDSHVLTKVGEDQWRKSDSSIPGPGETFSYDFDNRRTTYTNPAGDPVIYQFDGSMRTTRIDYSDGSWEGKGWTGDHLTSIRTRGGQNYFMNYDSDGNLQSQSGPYVNSRYTYNRHNLVTGITRIGPNGEDLITEYQYDPGTESRLEQIIYPDGTADHFTHYSNGQVETHTDRRGYAASYSYDSLGYIDRVVYEDFGDEAGWTEDYDYDVWGQLVRHTIDGQYRTDYEYRNDGLLIEKHLYDGGELEFSEFYEYDNRKDLVSKTDIFGNKTRFEYDQRHNLRKIINPLQDITEFLYYADGSVKEKLIYTNEVPVDDGSGDSLLQLISRTSYRYSAGNLTEEIRHKLEGNGPDSQLVTSVSWQNNRLEQVTDPYGRVTDYEYNPEGKLRRINYPMAFAGDPDNPDSHYEEYTYHPDGSMASFRDRRGAVTRYRYNPVTRTKWVEDHYNHSSVWTYDPYGNLVGSLDRDLLAKEYSYNRRGQLTGNRYLNVNSQEYGASVLSDRYHYNTLGRLTSYTDLNGQLTRYQYDRIGRMTEIQGPEPGIAPVVFDYFSPLSPEIGEYGYANAPEGWHFTQITDPNGNKTLRAFDVLGRLAKTHYADDTVDSYRYDTLGRTTQVIRAEGLPEEMVSHYTYDSLGRITEKRNAGMLVEQYDYLLNGNISVSDPGGLTTEYDFDRMRNLILQVNPGGDALMYGYDPMGAIVEEVKGQRLATDEFLWGVPHRYEYDSLGRMTAETNRLNNSQTYEYTFEGKLDEYTDYNGRHFNYAYDSMGRTDYLAVDQRIEKDFSYYPSGLVKEITNPAVDLSFQYNPRGQLTASDDGIEPLIYGYDDNGNNTLIRYMNSGLTTEYTYDSRNRIDTITDQGGGVTRFEYDGLGRETVRYLPNNLVTERGYNPYGQTSYIRTSKVTNGFSEIVSGEAYLYNDQNLRTHTINADGTYTRFAYNENGRLTDVLYPADTGKPAEDYRTRHLAGLHDQYFNPKAFGGDKTRSQEEATRFEQVNNDLTLVAPALQNLPQTRLDVERYVPEPSESQALAEAYNSLVPNSMTGMEPWQNSWNESFAYDEFGRRSRVTNGWGSIDYQYDAADRITAAGNRTYSYDSNGNVTAESVNGHSVNYGYTYDNRVSAVTSLTRGMLGKGPESLSGKMTYEYDGLGRRVSSTRYTKVHGIVDQADPWKQSLSYLGMGFNPASSRSVAVTNNGFNHGMQKNAADNPFEGVQTRSGLAGSSLKPDTEYYAYKGMEIVSTVSVVPSAFQTPQVNRAASRYYGSDLLGSVSMTADYSGNVVSEYDYDAFGHQIDGKIEGSLNFGYNGKPTDSATGLINFGYRDYAANLGRFTTVDPIRDGSDWYAYCHYDPVNFRDWLGLDENSIDIGNDSFGNSMVVNQYGTGTERSVFLIGQLHGNEVTGGEAVREIEEGLASGDISIPSNTSVYVLNPASQSDDRKIPNDRQGQDPNRGFDGSKNLPECDNISNFLAELDESSDQLDIVSYHSYNSERSEFKDGVVLGMYRLTDEGSIRSENHYGIDGGFQVTEGVDYTMDERSESFAQAYSNSTGYEYIPVWKPSSSNQETVYSGELMNFAQSLGSDTTMVEIEVPHNSTTHGNGQNKQFFQDILKDK